MPVSVLVLYDPRGVPIQSLAAAVARGVAGDGSAQAKVKGIDEADTEDLLNADALLLGSPNWSGITGR